MPLCFLGQHKLATSAAFADLRSPTLRPHVVHHRNWPFSGKHVSACSAMRQFWSLSLLQSRQTAKFWETQTMKTITQLFCFVVALLSLSVSPKARADCREGCDHAHANTFLGEDALFSLTSGADNTAIGFEALHDTTIALYNTALGYKALTSNTTGGGNTASGVLALASNTIGGDNTAAGYQALTSNVTGNSNTAVGLYTLYSNTVGSSNTASGASALSG